MPESSFVLTVVQEPRKFNLCGVFIPDLTHFAVHQASTQNQPRNATMSAAVWADKSATTAWTSNAILAFT